jgi:streptomycin 6-kinase
VIPVAIPDSLRQNALVALGKEAGTAWLAALPGRITMLAERWDLRLKPPFTTGIGFTYVAPCTAAGQPAVLKLALPTSEMGEAAALRHYGGRGAVRLLQHDAEQQAMLIERAVPGTPLLGLDDVEATAICAATLGALWKPGDVDGPYISVDDHAAQLAELLKTFPGAVPAPLAGEAMAIYRDLGWSQRSRVVLHGDLHHENILYSGERGWLAIDPKGYVGEPAYDTGCWIRNPPDLLRRPDPRGILLRRIDELSADLSLDRERVRGWAMAQAVLSALWCLDDESGADCVRHALGVAELLASAR